jgi:hypothetical protein
VSAGVSADAYDGPLSALHSGIDDLGVWLAIWSARNEPDARARRCASDAVDAIDAAISNLHAIRARLWSEIRAADDATAARADAVREAWLSTGWVSRDDRTGRPGRCTASAELTQRATCHSEGNGT